MVAAGPGVSNLGIVALSKFGAFIGNTGFEPNRGCLFIDGGTATELPLLPGTNQYFVSGMNDRGQVVE